MRVLLKTAYGKIIVIMTLLLLFLPALQKLQADYIFRTQQKLISDGSYRNQLAVVDYIFKDAGSEKFGYFVYSPQVFTYGMDYLLWWRGKYYYGYLPESQKKNTFYLIMYPPLAHDNGAHAFWIKNTIRTKSKVVERKIFQGDIVVEKRLLLGEEEGVDPNYYLIVR
jgi:hypothetical protein